MEKKLESKLIILHALTFLHPGTGQTTGVVDLPIQREVHTGFPLIAASSLKGSLRDKAEREWGKGDIVDKIFGSEDAQTAGALAVTDGRILVFPVRSLQKVFVWVTCPMVLGRLRRDLELAGLSVSGIPADLQVAAEQALVVEDAKFESPLVLEEIAFELRRQQTGKSAADSFGRFLPNDIHEEMRQRLAVVSDEDFQYLVRHDTQVSARIALNDRKTTTGDGGNLWYEETLPPETIMYALILAAAPRDGGKSGLSGASGVMEKTRELAAGYLQVGGNETVGQGWCRVTVWGDGQ